MTGSSWPAIGILALMLGLMVVMFVVSIRNLGQWKLSEALSDTTDSKTTETKLGASTPTITESQQPISSSSRLIAFFGMQMILVVYFGFSISIIWRYVNFGTLPNLTDITYFLAGGATLFAPYIANQAQTA